MSHFGKLGQAVCSDEHQSYPCSGLERVELRFQKSCTDYLRERADSILMWYTRRRTRIDTDIRNDIGLERVLRMTGKEVIT